MTHFSFVKPTEMLEASCSHLFQPHRGFARPEDGQAGAELWEGGHTTPLSAAGATTLTLKEFSLCF